MRLSILVLVSAEMYCLSGPTPPRKILTEQAEMRAYAIARERHSAGDQSTSYFLLKVPALNEIYLAHETEKGLRLIHAHGQAAQNSKLEARPAAEVLAGLVRTAKEHNGQPR